MFVFSDSVYNFVNRVINSEDNTIRSPLTVPACNILISPPIISIFNENIISYIFLLKILNKLIESKHALKN